MTTRTRLADLAPGQALDAPLLVASCERKVARNGKPFLALRLQDASGQVDAKVWERADALAPALAAGAIARVQATVDEWQGALQLRVDHAEPPAPGSVDLADLMPSTRFPVDAMWEALRAVVASLEDPWVRRFLDALLDDPDTAARLRAAPAAKTIHHAWIGGLLEHVLSVTRLADLVAGHYARYYPGLVDRSLLVAGAILHDLAKIRELSWDGPFAYTDEGQLVGHLVLGTELVSRLAERLDGFPEETRLRLQHLVVGHHGRLEYGSPITPRTPEAIVLHYLDDLDSKVNAIFTALADAGDAPWTRRVFALERPLYNVFADRGVPPLPTDLPGGPLRTTAAPPLAAAAPPPAAAGPAADADASPPAPDRAARRRKPAVAPPSAPDDAPPAEAGPRTLDLFGRS